MKLIGRLIKFCLALMVLAVIFRDFTAKWALSFLLRASLGAPVTIESSKVELLNGKVSFKQIRIGNPSGFGKGDLAKIPEISADWELSSLWEGRPHFNSIEMDIQELHLVRAPDGKINLLTLKILQPTHNSSNGQTQPHSALRFHVNDVVLTLGRVTYLDLSSRGSRIKGINLGVDHAVYHDLETIGEIVQIISWESLKGIGLNRLGSVLAKPAGFLGKIFGS